MAQAPADSIDRLRPWMPDALTLTEADLGRNRRIDLRFVLSSRTSDELRRLIDGIAALQREAVP